MATTIINPAQNTDSSGNNGATFLLGAIVLIVFLALFLVYGVPFIKGLSGGASGIQVNVPKSINVNVHQTK